MANHPIFAPAFHGDVAKVKRLLEEDGALVDVRDAKNFTPLHVAASRGKHEVVQLLLDHGADVQGHADGDTWTPIVWAAYRGHFDAVKVLIENGADVSTTGGNPIHFAAQRKHKDVCRLLVEAGAVDELVDSQDADLLNLFRAAYSYDTATVKKILSQREELIGRTDRDGRGLLHEAATGGDTKTVRVLLEFGADVNQHDTAGQTPVDRAASHNQHAVTKLFQKHLPN